MNRSLIAFCTALCVSVVCALAWARMSITFVCGNVESGYASFCTNATTLADSTVVNFCEDFETTDQACESGASSNCRTSNLFVAASACATPADYDGAGLDGTYGLVLNESDGGDSCSKYINSTDSDTYSVATTIQFGAVTNTTTNINFLNIYGNGAVGTCTASINTSGKWRVSINNGGTEDVSANGPVAGTTYHLWLDYARSSGANYCRLYVSTTRTKPASTEAATVGMNSQAQRVYFESSDKTGSDDLDPITLDNIVGSTSVIGTLPR